MIQNAQDTFYPLYKSFSKWVIHSSKITWQRLIGQHRSMCYKSVIYRAERIIGGQNCLLLSPSFLVKHINLKCTSIIQTDLNICSNFFKLKDFLQQIIQRQSSFWPKICEKAAAMQHMLDRQFDTHNFKSCWKWLSPYATQKVYNSYGFPNDRGYKMHFSVQIILTLLYALTVWWLLCKEQKNVALLNHCHRSIAWSTFSLCA